jgi:hypothetical protein
VAVNLAAMGPLPRHCTTDFSVYTVSVTRSGTISVRGVLYTVPSRLVGCRLKVHVYGDRLICYLGTTPVMTAQRAITGAARRQLYRRRHGLCRVPGHHRRSRQPRAPRHQALGRRHFDPEWFDPEMTDKDVQNALRANRRIRLHQPRPKSRNRSF